MTIKQVIVVRNDLDMGKGKIAAQVGHACVLGAEHVRKSNPEWFSKWWSGQEKVVLKVSSLKELEQIKQDAIELGCHGLKLLMLDIHRSLQGPQPAFHLVLHQKKK